MEKYEALFVAPNGDWIILHTSEEKLSDAINEIIEIAGIDKIWDDYPYTFIIKAHEKNKITLSDLSKDKIIDPLLEPLEFMRGWTVERAIKKIVAENKKAEQENPEDPLIWGLWET